MSRSTSIMSLNRETSRVCNNKPTVMLFKDREGLTDDLKYVITVPDLCDVKFLVGPDRLPVYGVRAVLSTRSRVFYQHILARQCEMRAEVRKTPRLVKILKKVSKCIGSEHDTEVNNGNDVITKVSILVESFDVRVFERLIRYVHCGIVTVDSECVIGLMNAANKFEFPELKQACWEYALDCMGPRTLPALLATASYYSHFKETRRLMQRIINKIQDIPDLLPVSRDLQDALPVNIGEYLL